MFKTFLDLSSLSFSLSLYRVFLKSEFARTFCSMRYLGERKLFLSLATELKLGCYAPTSMVAPCLYWLKVPSRFICDSCGGGVSDDTWFFLLEVGEVFAMVCIARAESYFFKFLLRLARMRFSSGNRLRWFSSLLICERVYFLRCFNLHLIVG